MVSLVDFRVESAFPKSLQGLLRVNPLHSQFIKLFLSLVELLARRGAHSPEAGRSIWLKGALSNLVSAFLNPADLLLDHLG